jgi:hypothetical protein
LTPESDSRAPLVALPLTNVHARVFDEQDKHLGAVDMTGVKTEVEEEDTSEEEQARQERIKNKPPLSECLSLYDFEVRYLEALPDHECEFDGP